MNRQPTHRLVATIAALAVTIGGFAACGGDSDTAGERIDDPDNATTSSSTTSVEPTPVDAAYRDVGPFGVGVVTLTLPTGNLAEVYYPSHAVEPNGGLESYRVSQFLPPDLQALIPDDAPDTFRVPAEREVEAATADGPFPLVVFSHGFSSFRLQSTHLMTHLSSWGMVVASADHPSRDLVSQLAGVPAGVSDSVDDVRATIELVHAASGAATGPLAGLVDPALVGLSGHSAGGFTAYSAASDPGIAGFISYASGVRGDVDSPSVPSLFIAGANDEVIEPERTAEAFEAATAPSWLWTLGESGHLAFSDLCAIGDGEGGLLGMAEAADLPVPDNLRGLATDGCEAPNADVRSAWPAIDHASVAFFRFVFDLDPDPVDLGPDIATAFEVDVTIQETT